MPIPPIHINAKGIGKPLIKLIESVSKGIGQVYEPTKIRRKAKAQADAGLILAKGEIKKKELYLRAAHRLAFRETRRQETIEAIVEQARDYLPETVSKEPVSDDWTFQFFEHCQDVTEAEMQKLWARMIAGEVAQPRTYSRRTLEVLKTFDTGDAKAFADYCSFCFCTSDGAHFTFQGQSTFDMLEQRCQGCQSHVVSLGLIDSQDSLYQAPKLEGWVVEYFGKTYQLSAPPPPPIEPTGVQPPGALVAVKFLTAVGEELVSLVSAVPVRGFVKKQANELDNIKMQFAPKRSGR